MSDAVLSLQKAIIEHLRANAGVRAVLGHPARVFDTAPQGVSYPYVSFGRVQASVMAVAGPEVVEQTLNLVCVSRFDGSEEVKAVAAAVRAAIEGVELNLDGHRLVSLRVVFVDVFGGSDGRTVYAVVRIRAVTEAE